MIGKVLEPGDLVEMLQTIPAREVVQLAELSTRGPLLLLRQICANHSSRTVNRFGKTNLAQVSHEIGSVVSS